VCVGIAETKTLAKLANHCAKKSHAGKDGVCDLTRLTDAERSHVFSKIDVGEVWGVGPRISERLRANGIMTVEALRNADPKAVRREFSVVMERTVQELNGQPCMAIEDAAPAKQQIMSSRSFGTYVTDLEALQEAVASYIATAAEKLRRQGSIAGMVQVYIRTSPFRTDLPQYSQTFTIPLPDATDDTLLLTRAALYGLRKIYRPGYEYQKAGIMLMNLTDARNQQASLFSIAKDNTRLMAVMDRINQTWGRGTLRSAATGITKSWAMKRERMSPRWTTNWAELPVVR
jgi:DNA polymerase V